MQKGVSMVTQNPNSAAGLFLMLAFSAVSGAEDPACHLQAPSRIGAGESAQVEFRVTLPDSELGMAAVPPALPELDLGSGEAIP